MTDVIEIIMGGRGDPGTSVDPSVVNAAVAGLAARRDDPFTRLYGRHVDQDVLAAYSGIAVRPDQGIFSLRMDDGPSADYTYSFQQLKARRLVATFSLIADRVNTAGYLTTAQALEMQQNGMQIACHSKSHGNTPASWAEYVAEAQTSKSLLEAAGDFFVANWVQPGTWIAAPLDYALDNPAKLDGPQGLLLRSLYHTGEAYIPEYAFGDVSGGLAGVKPLPAWLTHGAIPVNGYLRDNASLRRLLDAAIAGNGLLHVLIHTADIGVPGRISVIDFELFLDYVKSKVDSGEVVNMTATSAYSAGVRPEGGRNLLHDFTFGRSSALGAGATSSTWVGWIPFGGAPPLGVAGTGVNGGDERAVTVNNTTYLRHSIQARDTRSIRYTAWCKSAAVGVPGNARMIAKCRHTGGAGGTTVGATMDTGSIVTTDSWQQVRLTIGNQPSLAARNATGASVDGYNDYEFWLYANVGADVLWSSPEVVKI